MLTDKIHVKSISAETKMVGKCHRFIEQCFPLFTYNLGLNKYELLPDHNEIHPRLISVLLIGVLFLLDIQFCLAKEKRLALVIGNAEYEVSPLANPTNDAMDLSSSLRELGFEVLEHTNLSRREMRRAVREFGRQLKQVDIGLFYFAGHGVQVDGENYLLPVNYDIQEKYEVPDEALAASTVLRAMESAENALNIVILDACRNDPFESAFRSAIGGLARMNAPSGSLVAYATAPGRTAADGAGRNGVYTGQLLKLLKQPGLTIEQVFKRVRVNVEQITGGKQIPWEESSLKGDFYFNLGAPEAPENAQAEASGNSLELAFWDTVKDSKNPEEIASYLQTYPTGVFASLASARINALKLRIGEQALSVSIEGPATTPLNKKSFFTIHSSNAVRAKWSIGGFTDGWIDVNPIVDGHQIYVEPTDRSRLGDWFTLVLTIYDDQGKKKKAKKRFRISK